MIQALNFRFIPSLGTVAIAVAIGAVITISTADDARATDHNGASITLPEMNAARGKDLFAERGCVVCHSVNSVGGNIGPSLDASNMNIAREPFEFFASMWRGAEQMLHLQQADLGYQIDFSGQDIADIFAFVQDGEIQERFTEDDLPDHIRDIIDNGPSIPQN